MNAPTAAQVLQQLRTQAVTDQAARFKAALAKAGAK